jgi:hypothetical protein
MKPPIRESTIESAVVRYARRQGVRCVKLNGMHDRGKADQMMLYRGRVMFMEIKRPGGKPTALQLKWQRELTAEGFTSLIIDNIKDGCDAVDNFTTETP